MNVDPIHINIATPKVKRKKHVQNTHKFQGYSCKYYLAQQHDNMQ